MRCQLCRDTAANYVVKPDTAGGTSTGGWWNRPVNTLPLSVKICSGAPNWATAPLFDAICRENGIEHLLTQPRSPTTGKIERFHRSMRPEFLSNQPAFTNLTVAQQALDEWVEHYNTARPHQSLNMATPAQRFTPALAVSASTSPVPCRAEAMTGYRVG